MSGFIGIDKMRLRLGIFPIFSGLSGLGSFNNKSCMILVSKTETSKQNFSFGYAKIEMLKESFDFLHRI